MHIESVINAVALLTTATDNVTRKEADAFLSAVQASDEVWDISLRLIQHQDATISFAGTAMLRTKLKERIPNYSSQVFEALLILFRTKSEQKDAYTTASLSMQAECLAILISDSLDEAHHRLKRVLSLDNGSPTMRTGLCDVCCELSTQVSRLRYGHGVGYDSWQEGRKAAEYIAKICGPLLCDYLALASTTDQHDSALKALKAWIGTTEGKCIRECESLRHLIIKFVTDPGELRRGHFIKFLRSVVIHHSPFNKPDWSIESWVDLHKWLHTIGEWDLMSQIFEGLKTISANVKHEYGEMGARRLQSMDSDAVDFERHIDRSIESEYLTDILNLLCSFINCRFGLLSTLSADFAKNPICEVIESASIISSLSPILLDVWSTSLLALMEDLKDVCVSEEKMKLMTHFYVGRALLLWVKISVINLTQDSWYRHMCQTTSLNLLTNDVEYFPEWEDEVDAREGACQNARDCQGAILGVMQRLNDPKLITKWFTPQLQMLQQYIHNLPLLEVLSSFLASQASVMTMFGLYMLGADDDRSGILSPSRNLRSPSCISGGGPCAEIETVSYNLIKTFCQSIQGFVRSTSDSAERRAYAKITLDFINSCQLEPELMDPKLFEVLFQSVFGCIAILPVESAKTIRAICREAHAVCLGPEKTVSEAPLILDLLSYVRNQGLSHPPSVASTLIGACFELIQDVTDDSEANQLVDGLLYPYIPYIKSLESQKPDEYGALFGLACFEEAFEVVLQPIIPSAMSRATVQLMSKSNVFDTLTNLVTSVCVFDPRPQIPSIWADQNSDTAKQLCRTAFRVFTTAFTLIFGESQAVTESRYEFLEATVCKVINCLRLGKVSLTPSGPLSCLATMLKVLPLEDRNSVVEQEIVPTLNVITHNLAQLQQMREQQPSLGCESVIEGWTIYQYVITAEGRRKARTSLGRDEAHALQIVNLGLRSIRRGGEENEISLVLTVLKVLGVLLTEEGEKEAIVRPIYEEIFRNFCSWPPSAIRSLTAFFEKVSFNTSRSNQLLVDVFKTCSILSSLSDHQRDIVINCFFKLRGIRFTQMLADLCRIEMSAATPDCLIAYEMLIQ